VLRTVEEKDILYIRESVKAVQEKATALKELLSSSLQ